MSDLTPKKQRDDLRVRLTGKESAVKQVMEFLKAKALGSPTSASHEEAGGLTIHPHTSKEDVALALSSYWKMAMSTPQRKELESRDKVTEFRSENALLRRGRPVWALNRFRSSVLPSLIADLATGELSNDAKTRLRNITPKVQSPKIGDNKSILYKRMWEEISDFFLTLSDVSQTIDGGVSPEAISALRSQRRQLSRVSSAVQSQISRECTFKDLSVVYSAVNDIAENGNDGFRRTHSAIRRIVQEVPVDITDEAKVKAPVVETVPQEGLS
jgi:hypothetical protein